MLQTTPKLRRVAKTFVAEVQGIDLKHQRDDETMRWIERTLAENGVLIFPNQKLEAVDVGDIGKRLGTIEAHIFGQYRHEEVPEVSYVTNRTRENEVDPFGVTRASLWHSDEPYKPQLAKLTMLHALEVQKEKGGTWFTDVQGAYDALPADLKKTCDGLTSSFKVKQGFASQHKTSYKHPVTGRVGILLSPQHQIGFTGMENDDGIKLMEKLLAHATQDDFTYYHKWKVGDVVMWDNIGTLHRNAADGNPEERRVFLRTIVH